MPTERFTGGQVGKYINETKELDLEALISHAPIHDFSRPPALVKYGWRLVADQVKEVSPSSFDSGFEISGIHVCPPPWKSQNKFMLFLDIK
jgi:hypothetical protein